MFDRLVNFEKKSEFLKILYKNGAEGPKKVTGIEHSHTTKTLIQKLDNLSKEYEFLIPNICLYLFYNLGTFLGDFDAGYFYSPNLKEYFLINNPELDNITDISKESTKLIKMPLLAIYETNRFAIPKLQLYEKGEVIRESNLAGNESYTPDYWKKDNEKTLKNFKPISKWINEVIKK